MVGGSGALLLAVVAYMGAAQAFNPLGFLTFFRVYIGVFMAAALGIAGLASLLIGATAIGVRLALRPSDNETE